MTALSSTEYPYWLIMAGIALLILGCVGLTLRKRAAEPLADESDEGPYDAELNEVELYNRAAKEKRRERWAEAPPDTEPIDAQTQGTK